MIINCILKNGPFGVVQGGKSSGELFLYYLNELPFQLSLKIDIKDKADSTRKEFVDDLSILAKAATMEKLLIQLRFDFEKVSQYLINHLMVINESKSQLMMLFPPKNSESPELILENSTIKHQPNIKVLGVTLSDNMSFDSHLCTGESNMVKTINKKTAMLKTLKPYISTKTLGEVRASLINSTILYAAPL